MHDKRFLLLCCLILLALTACRPALNQPGDAVADTNVVTAPGTSAYDCSRVSEIPAAECQALVSFYEATAGPTWSEDGTPWEAADTTWLAGDTPCNWVGVTCVAGHVDAIALYDNELGGTLPDGLAALTTLRVLDLHSNQIGGELPAALGSLTSLEYLDLSGNHFSGAIPATLGNLAKLSTLDLAHNELSGAVPATLGDLAALRSLDTAYNQLSGALPATLIGLHSLETLRLNDNRLEGSIPDGLGALPGLGEVNLAHNRLTGAVPAGLTAIAAHDLSGNRLDGTIAVRAGEPVQANGVQFTGDPDVATAVWSESRPAVTVGEGDPWWAALPAHVRLTLVSGTTTPAHAPMGINVSGEAQIHVYPLAALDETWEQQVTTLDQLLVQKPSNPADPLPLLPPTNAAQMFHAQIAYLDFDNGRGIRYLTQYAQGIMPVSNDQLFYTFQGLTADGSAYVVAFVPIAASSLPATTTDALALPEMTGFLTNPESNLSYINTTVDALNALAPSAFDPDLSRLDALVRSLSITVPGTPVASLQGQWPDEGEAVDGQPLLQWQPFAGATHYELVVVDHDAYPPFVAFSYTGSETAVPVAPPLAPGSYSWTVRAKDATGATLAELNRQFMVYDRLELVAPVDMANVTTTPTLQWQPYAGAVNYEIIVVTGYPPEVVFTTTTTNPVVTITTPLVNPDLHYWTVWAKDSAGQTIASLSSSFNVAP